MIQLYVCHKISQLKYCKFPISILYVFDWNLAQHCLSRVTFVGAYICPSPFRQKRPWRFPSNEVEQWHVRHNYFIVL